MRSLFPAWAERLSSPGPPDLDHRLPYRVTRRMDGRERRRLAPLSVHDAGHGYDVFGMHPDWVAMAVFSTRFLYRRWFRVTSHGASNLPSHGRAILVANHSGMLPLDATMLYDDVVEHTDPPRAPRPIADFFVPSLPFVGTLFARFGVVAGTRGNVERLLTQEEMIMIFPEGTPGIVKPRSQRYRLQRWRVGHAELSLRFRAPIIPVAIIGAEEQWPISVRLGIHPFGAPFIPVPLMLLPLPVHYHIHYGAPMDLGPGDPDDPAVVEAAAERVRAEVQALVDAGLRGRKGVFA